MSSKGQYWCFPTSITAFLVHTRAEHYKFKELKLLTSIISVYFKTSII